MWQAYASRLLPRQSLARLFSSSHVGASAAKSVAAKPQQQMEALGGLLRQQLRPLAVKRSAAFDAAPRARPSGSPLFATRSVQTKVVRISQTPNPKADLAMAMSAPLVDRTTGHCRSLMVLQGMDYVGSALFAFTGCLKAAVVAEMDVLGCCLVGFTTAAGGGTIRDLLLGQTPVFWMKSPQYIVLAVATSLATFFLYPYFRTNKGLNFDENEQEIMNWADAVSLGAFACGGALNAMRRCVHPVVVVVCGLMTASFGGVIRDLLCQQRPWIFHRDSGLYASTALGGATTFVVTTQYAPWPVGMLACIGVVVGLRYSSWKYGAALPLFDAGLGSKGKASEEGGKK